jgi:hypothetical protein
MNNSYRCSYEDLDLQYNVYLIILLVISFCSDSYKFNIFSSSQRSDSFKNTRRRACHLSGNSLHFFSSEDTQPNLGQVTAVLSCFWFTLVSVDCSRNGI